MNIKQAKDYIKSSVNLYLKKDEFGEYQVPVVRQRPIFLLGAPGIGKTAIMEQIAQEMGIALISYSMTHHTRQSALGLPFITKKNYGGEEVSVSEYTMSEIIASIYETMEQSGIREGILFLDEINCVSETLAPSMLQFLQYKVFGRHQVPEGWVIVTAGNPPEFNKSVREFDVVTMDRLKLLTVEPDYSIFKTYAMDRHMHGAIISYLDIKKDQFYVMEMTTAGRSYVTARGWEDLSEILYLYEEDKLPVEEELVGQYLHNEKVVKEFTAYYELYNKYKKDYRVEDILAGHPSEQAFARAKEAPFDEKLSLLGMLTDTMQARMKEIMDRAAFLMEVKNPLKALQGKAAEVDQKGLLEMLELQIQARKKVLHNLQAANSLSEDDKKKHRSVIRFLEEGKKDLLASDSMVLPGGTESFQLLQINYVNQVNGLKEQTQVVKEHLHAMFEFVKEAFGVGNEMLIVMTEMTVGNASSRFIASFGSEDYNKYNQELMLSERQQDLQQEIAALDL